MSLKQAVVLLPTPRANDGIRPRVSTASEGWGKPLEQVATELPKLLPTPTEQDAKNSTAPPSQFERNSMALPALAVSLSNGASTDPPSDGAGSRSTALRLSPWFEEWMMGAPQGWSDPDCPLSATEFSSMQAGASDGG